MQDAVGFEPHLVKPDRQEGNLLSVTHSITSSISKPQSPTNLLLNLMHWLVSIEADPGGVLLALAVKTLGHLLTSAAHNNMSSMLFLLLLSCSSCTECRL
jgi:hypothetical protein